jgi:hypothetical protein
LLTNVKQKLIRMYGNFDQRDYGFEKFKAMIEAGVEKGYFMLNTAGLRDWLTLPQPNDDTSKAELPDEVDELLREITGIIRTSTQPQALLSYVKHSLIKKYGGFDETVYGYNQFKQLMEEGEKVGYFKLGINDKQVDFAFIDKNGKSGQN